MNLRLVADVVVDPLGNTDSAWRCERVDARGDVDSVAHHAALGKQHVADVNADSHLRRPVAAERRLHRSRIMDCIKRAVEAGERAVTDVADHPAVETRHQRSHQVAMPGQGADCCALIAPHQGCVPGDVAEHYRRQLARRVCRGCLRRTRHQDRSAR